VEAGVVDREPRPAPHLLGEGQVVGREPPLGAGRHERSDDHRGDPELRHERQVGVVAGSRGEHLRGDLRVELRPPRPHHRGWAGGRVGRHPVVAARLLRERHLRGVGVRHGHLLQHARRVVHHVHAAPVGERRHGELGEVAERARQIERGAEEPRGVGEEGGARARLLGLARAVGELVGGDSQLLGLQLERGGLVLQLLVRPLELERLRGELRVARLERGRGARERVLGRAPRRHVLVGEHHPIETARRVAHRVEVRLRPELAPGAGGVRDVVAQGRQPHPLRPGGAGENAPDRGQHPRRLELRVGEQRILPGDVGAAYPPEPLEGGVGGRHVPERVVHHGAHRRLRERLAELAGEGVAPAPRTPRRRGPRRRAG
jgi:hypothetical protein